MISFGPAALAVILAIPQAAPHPGLAKWGDDEARIIRVAAEEDASATDPAEASVAPEGEVAPPLDGAQSVAAEPAQCETPEDMLLMIAREREQLAAQKADAEAKIAAAALASEALDAEIARLEELKAEIESFANARSEEQQKELARLVKVYETMKAKEAAALLEDLDMGTTMELFGLMKERKAASILAAMSPVRARAISRILVEMAKLPGDRDLSGIRIK